MNEVYQEMLQKISNVITEELGMEAPILNYMILINNKERDNIDLDEIRALCLRTIGQYPSVINELFNHIILLQYPRI